MRPRRDKVSMAPTNEPTSPGRVEVDGRQLRVGTERFVAKGVTYGSFAPRADGCQFPEPDVLERDLGAIATAGFNTVRVYTVPPADALVAAGELGLRLVVGLDYHDLRLEHGTTRSARRRVRDAGRRAVDSAMETLAGRPEVLAVSVGNEVPGDLVRLHGARHVADLLGDLAARSHDADPEMLVTYTNYPTTEYLEVPGIDLVTFNVFLEDVGAFRRYLRHLQVVSGPRPVVITEVGLAALVHGERAQAKTLRAQLDAIDRQGLAGATVFSWTDEWSVGGRPVDGWGFGLTRQDRSPRPALRTASRWARRSLRDVRDEWPRVSVIVCAYNEATRIADCVASLESCTYPDLEVIVCDDGSTDATLEIARQFSCKTLALPHGGLSRARNAGIEVASGDVIAFLDADASCDPEWPYHLVLSLDDPGVVATGGPNLPFERAPLVERAVARSPGSPCEVLIADDRAEHVPGCNMAFHADALRDVGGFDPIYTAAGDDVDVCWKLLDVGGSIAFAPAAQVRHHRRASVRGYLRQQRGYGRAERLLMAAHMPRFNRLGQAKWAGFVYGSVALLPRLFRPVVYHGPMGRDPYQSVAARPAQHVVSWGTALVPFAPVALGVTLVLGLWSRWAILGAAAVLVACIAFACAIAASVDVGRDESAPWKLRLLVAGLHVAQPIARTWGRLRTPNRVVPSRPSQWTGDRVTWLRTLVRESRSHRLSVREGGATEACDLRWTVGPFLEARVRTAVVWHWVPRYSVSYRPRRPLATLLVVVGAVAVVAPLLAAVLVALSVAALSVEALQLRLRVAKALESSIAGVDAADEPGQRAPWRSKIR